MFSFIVYEHPYKLIVYDFHVNLEKVLVKIYFINSLRVYDLFYDASNRTYLSIIERLREKRFMPLEDTCCISELIELRDVIRPDIGPETC